MRPFYHFLFALSLLLLLSACVNTPVPAAYSSARFSTSEYVDNDYLATKQGRASCYAYLSLYAHGDCSVSSAMRDANISKVHSVEHHNTEVSWESNLLYREYTTIVSGE